MSSSSSALPPLPSSSSSSLTSLVFLNLPTSSLFGLNISSFNTTDRFRGIKNIPPGLHFCYFSVAPKSVPDKRDSKGKLIVDVDAEFSASSALGVRTGFFFTAGGKDTTDGVIVKKWDGKDECLVDAQDVEVENVRKNMAEIGREYLAPYENLQQPSSKHEVWRALTKHAVAGGESGGSLVLDRILGRKWECESTQEAGWETEDLDRQIAANTATTTMSTSSATSTSATTTTTMTTTKEEDDELGSKGLGYTHIDLKRTWPPDAVGRERTIWARDKSYALKQTFALLQPDNGGGSGGGESSLLAELSISLILSVLLANYSSTSQFKTIAELSLSSADAIRTHPGYMRDLLSLLQSCFEFARLALGEDDAAKRAEEEEEDDENDGYMNNNGAVAEEAVLEEFISGGDTFLKDMLRRFGRNLDYAAEDDRDVDGAKEGKKEEKEKEKDEATAEAGTPKEVIDAFAAMKKFALENFSWHLDDSYVRKGMLQLPPEEGAGSIFVEMEDMEGEDERGEYAPVIVEM